MTQRSIFAGPHPSVTVYAGTNVSVRGVESEYVTGNASVWAGLKLETIDDEIKVQIGMNGKVEVPIGSNITVFAGMNAEVEGVKGDVSVTSGMSTTIRACGRLVSGSAGWSVNIDCETIGGSEEMKIEAGRDLRIAVHTLPSIHLFVTDLGGEWEGIIGDGSQRLTLTAGGEVILATDQIVKGVPPDYVLGHIERLYK